MKFKKGDPIPGFLFTDRKAHGRFGCDAKVKWRADERHGGYWEITAIGSIEPGSSILDCRGDNGHTLYGLGLPVQIPYKGGGEMNEPVR